VRNSNQPSRVKILSAAGIRAMVNIVIVRVPL
jgi:hypothetical protein